MVAADEIYPPRRWGRGKRLCPGLYVTGNLSHWLFCGCFGPPGKVVSSSDPTMMCDLQLTLLTKFFPTKCPQKMAAEAVCSNPACCLLPGQLQAVPERVGMAAGSPQHAAAAGHCRCFAPGLAENISSEWEGWHVLCPHSFDLR